jgi:hypothetical protein
MSRTWCGWLCLQLGGNAIGNTNLRPLTSSPLYVSLCVCREFFGETSFVLGTLGGVLGLTAVGIGYTWDASRDAATNFASGANWAWVSCGMLLSVLCAAAQPCDCSVFCCCRQPADSPAH